jgi:hypothetical protein
MSHSNSETAVRLLEAHGRHKSLLHQQLQADQRNSLKAERRTIPA